MGQKRGPKMTEISAKDLKKMRAKIVAQEKAKAKKAAYKKVDGLSAQDIKKIRQAVRQIWHRSHVRKLVVQRCTGEDGFPYCEQCKNKTPKLFIDHKIKVGEVDGGFIERMFTPSKNLQGLCKKCHDLKTKVERATEENFY